MALVLFALLLLSAIDHLKCDGWFANQSGGEFPVLWAAGVLYFVVNGGGSISLDRLLGFQL
jgi:uncharacterized membrane protein YphA (DoxX/SURF4 family)